VNGGDKEKQTTVGGKKGKGCPLTRQRKKGTLSLPVGRDTKKILRGKSVLKRLEISGKDERRHQRENQRLTQWRSEYSLAGKKSSNWGKGDLTRPSVCVQSGE